jgi:hypothetical protein
LLKESERSLQISKRALLRILSTQVLLLARGHVAARSEGQVHARIRVRLFEMFQRVGREEAKVAVEEFRRVAKTGDSRADGEERKSGETLENDKERGESKPHGGKANGVHAIARMSSKCNI